MTGQIQANVVAEMKAQMQRYHSFIQNRIYNQQNTVSKNGQGAQFNDVSKSW